MTKLLTPKTSLIIMTASLALGGCALFEGKDEAPFIPPKLIKPSKEDTADNDRGQPATGQPSSIERSTAYYQTPKPPSAKRTTAGSPPPPVSQPIADDVTTAVNLDSMPLPQFATAIFGTILKRNVSIDPQVMQRTDLVSLRTGKAQSGDQLFRAAQAVLRSYGVAVTEFQGLVRIVPDKAEAGYLPEIRRGRAQPDVPGGLRPVFYLAELEHITVANATPWIRTLFGGRVTVQDDNARNALLLSGQSDTLAAAMEALQLLDQPLLRGRTSARITPVFWSADEMAKRLVDILTAEGYSASLTAGAQSPLIVLPIAPANSIVVFAASEAALNHTLRWAQELDQRPEGRSGGYITYQVRNANASDLAKTLQEVFGSASSLPSQSPATTGTATASPTLTTGSAGKKVVVNPTSNSLIIQTTPTEYQQWHGLLQELDKPAKSAMIMATVAEVRLTDSEQFGFQWLLNQFRLNGQQVNIGSSSTISASATIPNISVASLAGTPRALLTMLASTNKIRILSNPSVVARNGEAATIQVGQEVPILTSQYSAANTSGTPNTGILQTIQYRSTGVILKVKPVIHSSGKLDLDVAQEVSAAQTNETGVNSTPIILTRKIDTKLTVTDGNTMLLGGLISENRTAGNSGIPILKDIPIAGALFRTSASKSAERTELVVMLTPYVIEDDNEAQAITAAFRNQFGWSATDRDGKLPQLSTPTGKLSTEISMPPADKNSATLTDGRPSTKTQDTYKSKRYVLPQNDQSVDAPANTDVAPTPQPIANQPPPVAPAPLSPPATPPASVPTPPEAMKPVTDQALKDELLKAIRGGR